MIARSLEGFPDSGFGFGNNLLVPAGFIPTGGIDKRVFPEKTTVTPVQIGIHF
jgi:hypothetical protein